MREDKGKLVTDPGAALGSNPVDPRPATITTTTTEAAVAAVAATASGRVHPALQSVKAAQILGYSTAGPAAQPAPRARGAGNALAGWLKKHAAKKVGAQTRREFEVFGGADPAFALRCCMSTVYVVKVAVLPADGSQCASVLTGTSQDPTKRRHTLLNSGGWVAPPPAERAEFLRSHFPRLQHVAEHAADHKPGRWMWNTAVESTPDETEAAPPGKTGYNAPRWAHVADPTLEDV